MYYICSITKFPMPAPASAYKSFKHKLNSKDSSVQVKDFNKDNKVTMCERYLFEEMYKQNYTHFTKMSGNWLDILNYSRIYKIIPLDDRINKHINKLSS